MYFYKSYQRFTFVLLVCFFFAFAATARTFNLMDGDVINGEVQDYDIRSDRVTFKTANGRSTVKADDLDNDSYRYVREWDALRQFSNPDNCRITLYDPEKLNIRPNTFRKDLNFWKILTRLKFLFCGK